MYSCLLFACLLLIDMPVCVCVSVVLRLCIPIHAKPAVSIYAQARATFLNMYTYDSYCDELHMHPCATSATDTHNSAA